ncbi:MAG: M23 family metallopeptidase [Gammaproteobacteria bacterium]|jgi:murein DD-endopeptidase MepM/ murein hydrolase activator NlpD
MSNRLLGVLLLGFPILSAASECSLGWVCVAPQPAGGSVELVATNLQPWPLTVSLRVDTESMVVDPAAEVTRSLDGDERQVLMVLARADADPGDTEEPDYRYEFDWTVGRTDAVHDDDHVYQLPFASGQSYRVLQGYGARFSHTGLEHWTVDFDMPVGTPVHAARGGVVVRVQERYDRSCWEPGCGRYANFVVVLHEDMTTGEYYHLMHRGASVSVGQQVEPGALIGYSGDTGKSTMPHLHFGVYRASSWGRTQSLPVRFVTAAGLVEQPRSGRRYRRP